MPCNQALRLNVQSRRETAWVARGTVPLNWRVPPAAGPIAFSRLLHRANLVNRCRASMKRVSTLCGRTEVSRSSSNMRRPLPVRDFPDPVQFQARQRPRGWPCFRRQDVVDEHLSRLKR